MLFRKEVLENHTNGYYGKAVVITPIHYSILLALLVALVFITVIYLFSSDYSKKEKVKGYLVPTHGISRVYSHVSGVVSEVAVKEGDRVSAGTMLMSVTNNKFMANSLNSDKEKIKELNIQISLINEQISQYSSLYQEREVRLEGIINFLKQERKELRLQGELLRERLKLAKVRLTSIKKLHSKGNASKNEVNEQLDFILDLQQKIQEHNTIALKSETNIANSLNDKARLPFEKQQQVSQLEIELSKLSNTKVSIQEGNKLLVKAPINGVVTSIKLNVGEFASSGDYLVTILPDDSKLEAEVYIPTRAIAFVSEGDEVNLKLDAFPFQKFGMATGRVSHVSRSVVFASETASKLSFDEPVYKVSIELLTQNIKAYGNKIDFIPGMLLQADINTGKRTLLEWLLEPIYIIKGY
ncbi:HlyD family efflux transporter periplasmic adaptor subunit [Shewanella sp. MBTL60-007]|uniref:HlyD family efflux transporter periplasmic adaptor subunit n=1 Tax=Shewanella sp. MBTL60-007 TaxID=2815911 RepID=UPI001BC41786|nr:HlyD family efflux transporter periplasmic adaptor subunit [Shewanella sp. MBTL60-007]GIU33211.1 toxin secretion, membrane fusion protein [Shewanella sp. MBTL60-007]